VFLVLSLLAGSAPPLVAADEPVEVIDIIASPTETVQRRAVTGFATAIDPETHADKLETLSEALAESVGVQVRRFGGLGAFSTMSIRGSSANQVQVYLDGIPLSRARNETVNLADLPLDSLERIEVYRGTAPVMFGAGGIGGVVNLVTKPPSTEPVTDFTAGYGSFETRKVVAAHTRKVGPFELLGFVTYLGSKGDFTFLDDRGTEQNPADDRETTRRDNAFDSVEGLFKGAWSSPDGLRVDLTSETFFKDQGLPGAGNRNDLPQSASLRDLRALNYLRATRPGLLDAKLDLIGTLFGIYERLGLSDRQNKLGGGNQDGQDTTSVVGGNLGATYALTESHAVEGMTELSYERLAPFSDLPEPTNYPDQTRWHGALAVQDRAAFLDERILVVPTLRYEHLRDSFTEVDLQGRPVPPRHTDDRDLWTPALGISVSPQPWLLLKGNISRQQRAPNFSELFGHTGTVTGESKLKPETGINRDVGLVLQHQPQHWLDRVRLEYAYFNNDIDDLIVLKLLGQGRFKPQNVNGARVRGHEVALATTWFGHFDLDANYTHQDSENLDPDYRYKQLPLRPADELYTRLTFFGSPGKLFYEFNLVDGNYLDSANYDHVRERDVHTLGLTLTPWQSLALTFEVRNLTDNQIADVGKFPLPGRSFFGTIKLNL
jgi:outer membrane cobalamin receptor